ncbi:winged helix DNA-binding domain-containing protein [Ornithinimicrobium cerasi]|uniref:winged helix DNA-binding domain-containing protein n=1 Tax=Ornithinimicrobium cerasi TaxID=2248773 RepID=UPI000EFF7E5C|nr:winged helix DNA-binding domain-containing protein [Ornithinimicrobium cerasi]
MSGAPVRHVDDRERRARLARRHAVHPSHRVQDTVAATRAMTVLHATEAATVHLAVHARTEGTGPADVDRALYEERSVVKQLAMRRTLFVFPRDLLPAALGSASARVAAEQRRVIARDVEAQAVADDGAAWLEAAGGAVLRHLAERGPLPARQLREDLPELAGTMTYGLGKSYGGTAPLAPRVLTWLGAQGLVVRGPNTGHWRLSRPTWTLTTDWLGGAVEPLPAEEGYAELVRRWLRTFGPGTVEDVQWWLGSTKTAARASLSAVGAVPVGLDGGSTGWLLPDDVDPEADVEPWAALLPTLDPTTMGWRGREFYLDPALTTYLFDTNGNAGTTAWWGGRLVGAWVQDEDGAVRVVLAPGADPGAAARAALEVEARRLTRWLDGVRISNVYSSQLMKGAALP